MSNPVIKKNKTLALLNIVEEAKQEFMKQQQNSRIKIKTYARRLLADTLTPVSIYLKVRDHFGSGSALLESTDFRSLENCFSFIVTDPIASFQAKGNIVIQKLPNGTITTTNVADLLEIGKMFNAFTNGFEILSQTENTSYNGIFGHTSFEGVQYFDTLKFDENKRHLDTNDLNYSVYRYVIAINHFKDELFILENVFNDAQPDIEKIEVLIQNNQLATHRFKLVGEETSNLTDEEFRDFVRIGKHHCHIGDVFQIVLSRRFSQGFKGDEFNLYRVLRSINPSPYLFFFDFGSYKIFGSSPESQIVVKNNVATIHPIAGTYRRTGEDEEDRCRALALTKDPKENAEHIMLVDLARNDLSRHAKNVRVAALREVHFYSHVIHLVSKVEGDLNEKASAIEIFGDTFPAGTLSGAPKYKAIQIIQKNENMQRSFYGGAIGLIGFDGSMNQAIVIRSFLSKDNQLHYQAGAGIVAASDEESELQEVNNKLGALKKALLEAEKI